MVCHQFSAHKPVSIGGHPYNFACIYYIGNLKCMCLITGELFLSLENQKATVNFELICIPPPVAQAGLAA